MLPEWLDPSTLRAVLLGVLGGLLLLALLVVRFVQRMVVRVVLVGLLGAFALLVFTEREALADCADDCSCELLGFDVEVPACRERLNG